MATRNTFTFIGKIIPVKDTEKFMGYDEKTYESGWKTQKLRFNVICGDDRHLAEINAGCWKDDSKNNAVYTFAKDKSIGDNGKLQIPWNKRNNKSEIDKVAGYMLFITDTDTRKNRDELEKSGDVEAFEKSKAKRKHFITGTDFIEQAKKIVYSDKIKDWVFRISGNINYNYSRKDGMCYASYEVNRICRVPDDTTPISNVSMNFYYTEGFMDKDSVEDCGKAILSGFTQFYDSQTKKDWFTPISLVMRENDINKVTDIEDLLNEFDDNEVCYTQITCKAIDGAQRQDIAVKDLPEKVQKAIRLGVKDEKQALREAGGQMYGERIREMRFDELGSKIAEPTVYTAEMLVEIPHVEEVETVDMLPFDIDDDEEI